MRRNLVHCVQILLLYWKVKLMQLFRHAVAILTSVTTLKCTRSVAAASAILEHHMCKCDSLSLQVSPSCIDVSMRRQRYDKLAACRGLRSQPLQGIDIERPKEHDEILSWL